VFGISMWEIALIVLVALIVLGPRQLTETARVAGRLYRELQKLTSDVRNTIDWDTISSPTTTQQGASSQQYNVADSAKADQDFVPPPGEKSGPDFYAELLEKSAPPDDGGSTEIIPTPEGSTSLAQKQNETASGLKM